MQEKKESRRKPNNTLSPSGFAPSPACWTITMVLTSVPLQAWAADADPRNRLPPAESKAKKPEVQVNRTLPKVTPHLRNSICQPPRRQGDHGFPCFPGSADAGGKNRPNENAALSVALTNFAKRREGEDVSALTDFLEQHPHSAWRISLLTNLGRVYFGNGYSPRPWTHGNRLGNWGRTATICKSSRSLTVPWGNWRR